LPARRLRLAAVILFEEPRIALEPVLKPLIFFGLEADQDAGRLAMPSNDHFCPLGYPQVLPQSSLTSERATSSLFLTFFL
jgi:hypothetical protein